MNLKELKDLIQLIQEADIDELEVERDGVKVRIKKTPHAAPIIHTSAQPHIVQPAIHAAQNAGQESVTAPPAEKKDDKLVIVNSPMVGTFYRASSPDSAPLVEIGGEVKKGQVLCIIEAMKLMNEIESDMDGKVVQILAENGHAVEYGQPLFKIEPNP